MICHKLGRILTGNPNHADRWHDIAGYATLVENILLTGKSHPTAARPGEWVQTYPTPENLVKDFQDLVLNRT